MAMAAAYQRYRRFSAEIYLQNFLCMPNVTVMQTHALPLPSPMRRRPTRRLKTARAAAGLATRPNSRPDTQPLPAREEVPGAAPPHATTPDGAGRGYVSPVVLRRARLVALGVGGFLLPWCVLLGATLPATAQAQHWPAAWVGLDAGEAIAALGTAVLLARGDARAALTAAAGGALLLTDAWFDVCTSAPGLDHLTSLTEAAFVELPLACAAFWLAIRLTRGSSIR
jgi:hypothetical protein